MFIKYCLLLATLKQAADQLSTDHIQELKQRKQKLDDHLQQEVKELNKQRQVSDMEFKANYINIIYHIYPEFCLGTLSKLPFKIFYIIILNVCIGRVACLVSSTMIQYTKILGNFI